MKKNENNTNQIKRKFMWKKRIIEIAVEENYLKLAMHGDVT